jgi:hypothetical protein
VGVVVVVVVLVEVEGVVVVVLGEVEGVVVVAVEDDIVDDIAAVEVLPFEPPPLEEEIKMLLETLLLADETFKSPGLDWLFGLFS